MMSGRWLFVALVAAAAILLVACSPEAPVSEPVTGRDAEIDALATAHLLGKSDSDLSCEAFECRYGRQSLKDMLRTALQKYEEYEGQGAESIRQAVNVALPQAPAAYVDAVWEACPTNGAYGARFSPGEPLDDGTVIWSCEVSCAVHTPEAYLRYREGIEQ